jgi:hypothetical protein
MPGCGIVGHMGSPGWRAALLLAAAPAGCYAPTPVPGGACTAELECPSGLICDQSVPDTPTCIEAPASSNDRPSGAIDVSAGGRFDFDARGARDDFDAPCAAASGPDIFFRISLPAPEVLYLDTDGSSGSPAIAIHQGGCTSKGGAEACVAQTCGEVAQGAWRLPAGEHCIIVDHAGAPPGPGQLTVLRTHRDGDPLPDRSGVVTGNTCNDDNSNDASCGCEPGKDHHYFFTVCPATTVTAHVDTCTATWDTVLQLRDGNEERIACNDDGMCGDQSTLTRQLTGPGLFWAIVDGCFDCGAYTMQYSY